MKHPCYFIGLGVFALSSLLPFAASAHSLIQNLGLNLSASYEIGRLGNTDAGLQNRTMTAESLQALGGYALSPSWLLGASFNYRFQQQQTALADVGNTNLAGNAWLIGVGAQYLMNDHWSLQGALHFLGKYSFKERNIAGQEGKLNSPKGIDLKVQYRLEKESPWSIDAVGNFISWGKITANDTDLEQASKQWMLGLGITYRLGSWWKDRTVEATPISSQELTRISGFEIGSANLTPEQKNKIREFSITLKKHPNQKVSIEGYTDSTGPLELNSQLSKKRAESAKAEFLANGVSVKQIEISGKGSNSPFTDNGTEEGRTQNRRVEIRLSTEGTTP